MRLQTFSFSKIIAAQTYLSLYKFNVIQMTIIGFGRVLKEVKAVKTFFSVILVVGFLFCAYLNKAKANLSFQDVQSGSSVYIKTKAVRAIVRDDDRRKDICRSGQCQRKKALSKSVPATSLSVQARKFLSVGDQQYKAKKYSEAVAAYQKSNKIKPSYEAYFGMGEAYSEIDKDAEATQAYTQAIRLNPKLGEAHYNLGVLQYEQKQYDAALKSLQQAVALGTPDSGEYLYLGSTLRFLNRLAEAETHLRKSLQLNPKNGEVYLELGRAFYFDKKYPEALTELRKSAELLPNNADVWLSIDNCLFAQEKQTERLAPLLKALQVKPELKNDIDFALALSGVYRENKKITESVEWADNAIKIDSKNARAYYFKSLAFFEPPNMNAAAGIEAANKSIAFDPKNGYVYYHLGIGYLNSTPPNYPAAVEVLTKAAELIPNEGDVFTKLAIAHFQKTPPDFKEVVQTARRAVQINPQDFFAHFFLGSALSQLSQNDQAVVSLKETVRLNPNFGAASTLR